MPSAIFLYEIDPSFGPNILAEYYLDIDHKVPPNILKEFSEKHKDKEFFDVTTRNEDIRYYSRKVNAESIKKDNFYLGFILREGEDLLSLKSLFQKFEKSVVQNYASDKAKMSDVLKNTLNSALSLMEKLKEPTIVKETINEKTKQLLDEEKLQEARELIDLGEEIPERLSAEVKEGEQFLANKFYKKAKRSFLKAAELAAKIQEDEIALFLENKAEQVSNFPDLIKEREDLYKVLEQVFHDLESNRLYLYGDLAEPIDRLLYLSNNLEEEDLIKTLTELKKSTHNATQLAKELYRLDKKIKELFNKV
ncbi:MAG: hypothetical protein ACFE8L_09890 [Candidatus Hodarchaeota archaeon]